MLLYFFFTPLLIILIFHVLADSLTFLCHLYSPPSCLDDVIYEQYLTSKHKITPIFMGGCITYHFDVSKYKIKISNVKTVKSWKKVLTLNEQKVKIWENIALFWMLFYWMEARCDRSNQAKSTQLTKLAPMKAIGQIVCFQGKK